MIKRKGTMKKFLSLLLAVVLVASYLPISPAVSAANTADVYGGAGHKVSDRASVNEWKGFFDPTDPDNLNTSYAGGVWTDKSVFNSVAAYTAATDENDGNIPLSIDSNNFLVSLSAIASNKEIEGYSALPSDTVLVLDLSGSMKENQAIPTLAASANDAISRLMELNLNNRVSVIAYSGNTVNGDSTVDTATVILPMGRYTPNDQGIYLVDSWTTGNGWNQTSHTGIKVATGVTAQIAEGITSTFSVNNSKDAEGGTYIQNGLSLAWQQLNMVKDTKITEGVQAGISRIPIIVLMSDGAATTATTSYTNVGKSNVGDGTTTYATNGVSFLAQLTASWVRDKAEEKYGTTPLFYTLGLNVSANAPANNLLNPSRNTGTDQMWSTFIGLANKTNKSMKVTIAGNSQASIQYTAPVGDAWSENYVTQYFPANDANAMAQAFSNIVQQIVVQSKYYPTYVQGSAIDNDGYLQFDDYVGKNMEVKAVKGIALGDKLYTGETFARLIHTGGMGTVESPTDVGENLVLSLQKRLNISNTEDVHALLNKAYQAGQLSYNPTTGAYSNYIGWYADQDENFVGFWDGQDDSPEAVPAEFADRAYYAVKSYLYYDAVGEGYRKTDMMYASVRVSTCVKRDPNRAAEVGDARVLVKLPAALIPLVEYEVKLNGTDLLAPTELAVIGANAPFRLLYEVGLKSEIDLLDIENTAPDALETDADGNFVFYTNQWGTRPATNEHFSYSTNKNTISFFEPSLENERYYYTYDTPIYADRNGTLYTGATAPTGNVHHRTVTYISENGNVTAEYAYELVSQHVLTGTGEHDHLTRKEDGSWVINRGTLHHYFADYEIAKNPNDTETLDVAFMPFVHDNLDDSALDHFHVDFYLGNNGKLVLSPVEGIKISKVSDATITDKTIDYTFTVTTQAGFNETLQLVKEDAQGNRTESTITFTNGAASLTLKHDEAAWILGDAMVGKTFTVAENQGDGYIVSSVNGSATDTTATLTVTGGSVETAAFVNTLQQSGAVAIGKVVNSTVADHQNKAFSFTVSIAGDDLVAGRSYTITRSDGQTFSVTDAAPATVTLTHNQYMTLTGLPVGTTVTATEADYTSVGFTTDQRTQSAVVEADTTLTLTFVNTYASAPVTIGTAVAVKGVKHMVSDVGITGTFTFRMDRYNSATGSYEAMSGAEASVSYSTASGDKNFQFNFSGETYSATGTYHYRITEVQNEALAASGIILDTTPFYFSVVVEDDGAGKLYIANVTSDTDSAVTGNAQSGWVVTGAFTNTYSVSGAAKVVISTKKTVTSDWGVTVPPAGFTFDLFAADEAWNIIGTEPVATSSATGADGLADIQLLYNDAANDIGTHYYVLKEHVPAEKAPGITYTDVSYGIRVDVGHKNGIFTLEVTTYSGSTQLDRYVGYGAEGIIFAEPEALEFENTYKPESVSAEVTVHKELTGASLSSHNFSYEFVQVADRSGTALPGAAATAVSLSATSVQQFALSSAGTTYWRFTEKIPEGAVSGRFQGVTYDAAIYIVEIQAVADNQNGKLIPTVTIYKDGAVTSSLVFRNAYTADPATDVVLSGTKTLLGDLRKIQSGAFSFQLKDADGNVLQTVTNGTPTGDYTAPFSFEPLTFTQPGAYSYTISEVIPEGAANGTLDGITYDTKEVAVTVTVSDSGTGKLTAVIAYADSTTFSNTYSVSPTSYTIRGYKSLIGDDLMNYVGSDAFRFALYEASRNGDEVVEGALLATAPADVNGNFSFAPAGISQLNYSEPGTHLYIVKEVIPEETDPLMTYDTSRYLLEVRVTDNAAGKLVANATITKITADSSASASIILFTNNLAPQPVTLDLEGIKLYNLDLPENTFSFHLYEAQMAGGSLVPAGEPLLTAYNKADGTFRFEETELVDTTTGNTVISNYLTFSQPGVHYFVVKENIPEGVDENNTLNGVTYDATVYELIVVVDGLSLDGRIVLNATLVVNGEIGGHLQFENSYNASAAEGVSIVGVKTLTGRDLVDGEFTFGLYEASVSDNIVTAGDLVETATNENGIFTFSTMHFDDLEDAGLYCYVVKEIIPEGVDENNTLDGITYDDTAYVVVFRVDDNGDGTMSITGPLWAPLNEDGSAPEDATDAPITFRNVYTPEEEPPVIPDEEEPPTTPEEEEPPTTPDEDVPPTTPDEDVPPTTPEEAPPTTPDEDVPPQTGDPNHPLLWASLLALSFVVFGAILTIAKKKRI